LPRSRTGRTSPCWSTRRMGRTSDFQTFFRPRPFPGERTSSSQCTRLCGAHAMRAGAAGRDACRRGRLARRCRSSDEQPSYVLVAS
jgi:hypothetical protein